METLDRIEKMVEQEIPSTEKLIEQEISSPVVDPPIVAFLKEVQGNPEKYPANQILDKLLGHVSDSIHACWDSKLPQSAELHFNLVAFGFSMLQKLLLHRHGVTAQPVPQPQAEIPQQPGQKPLIIL